MWVEEGLPEERFGKQTPRSYEVVLRAAQLGQLTRTITLAHQIEAIALDSFTKKGGKELKPLSHYLRPLRKRKSLDESAADVAAALDRKIARQQRKKEK